MPLFEKQPGVTPRPVAWFAVAFVVLISAVINIAFYSWLKNPAITVPPPPSNYAVLATDGKGRVYWMEMKENNPYGDK